MVESVIMVSNMRVKESIDVNLDMQTELENQRLLSALADLMKTGDCYCSASQALIGLFRRSGVLLTHTLDSRPSH